MGTRGLLSLLLPLSVVCLTACGSGYSENGLSCFSDGWTVTVGTPPNRELTTMIRSGPSDSRYRLPDKHGEVVTFSISVARSNEGTFRIKEIELLGAGEASGLVEPWVLTEIKIEESEPAPSAYEFSTTRALTNSPQRVEISYAVNAVENVVAETIELKFSVPQNMEIDSLQFGSCKFELL